MSEFLDYFEGRQVGWKAGRPIWWILQQLRYNSVLLATTVVVPAELVTDLASVPRAPFTFWLAGGRGARSAVVHDFAYLFGYYLDRTGQRIPVTKAQADDVFLESLLADPISGTGAVVAQLMYRAVQIGGRGVWKDTARTVTLNPVWSSSGWLEAP